MRTPTITTTFILCLTTAFLITIECLGQTSEAFQVVKSRSTLKWTGYYLFNFGEHTGTIDILDGKLFLNGEQSLSGFVTVDMRSIKDTDMPYNDGGKDLSEHLMSKDFFDAPQYPQAKIDILSTEAGEDAGGETNSKKITANLTIKGVTAPVTLFATLNRTNNELRVAGKFKFDRTRWGIEYNSGKVFSDVGDGAISDAIALEFDITTTTTSIK